MDSVVLHPELLRTYKVAPKTQQDVRDAHIKSHTGASGHSRTSATSRASVADSVHVRDPYERMALMGSPTYSAELSSYTAMIG